MAAVDDIGTEQNAAGVGSEVTADFKPEHVNALGSVQLRHPVTNDIILVPTPSNDPNDPINWCAHRLCQILGT